MKKLREKNNVKISKQKNCEKKLRGKKQKTKTKRKKQSKNQ